MSLPLLPIVTLSRSERFGGETSWQQNMSESSISLAQSRTKEAPARTLLEELLDEQQSTAVESFSAWHSELRDEPGHAQSRYYRNLLPATPPKAGEQYAFEVDLDACSGCKACVTACHSLNGLDDQETWREVGLLFGGKLGEPYQQHVTSACHHCLEPGCLIGCPTNAYVKDPQTGIVKHLDDQCFGCQYCILACPYEVPKYNERMGIVRKCDMCSQRLAVGEAPACVQACPQQAIQIRVVNVAETMLRSESGSLVPTAPLSSITLPTTIYKSLQAFPERITAAQIGHEKPQHGHPPLSWMLTLTQASTGIITVAALLQIAAGISSITLLGMAWTICLIGLITSTLHLGRPLLAYRALLGLRHSWLSREILTFGIYFKLLSLCLINETLLPQLGWAFSVNAATALLISTSLAGIVGVYCSAMVYIFTKRPLWTAKLVGSGFALTTILLGSGFALLGLQLALPGTLSTAIVVALILSMLAAGIGQSMLELLQSTAIGGDPTTPFARRARLLATDLRRWELAGSCLQILGFGGVLLGLVLAQQTPITTLTAFTAPMFMIAGTLSLLGAQVIDRHLFFTAAVTWRMPGGMP